MLTSIHSCLFFLFFNWIFLFSIYPSTFFYVCHKKNMLDKLSQSHVISFAPFKKIFFLRFSWSHFKKKLIHLLSLFCCFIKIKPSYLIIYIFNLNHRFFLWHIYSTNIIIKKINNMWYSTSAQLVITSNQGLHCLGLQQNFLSFFFINLIVYGYIFIDS
jgi:hypothetical protein